jgi:site-specific DNA recombinase
VLLCGTANLAAQPRFGDQSQPGLTGNHSKSGPKKSRKSIVITAPRAAENQTAAKGIIHSPQPAVPMNAERQDTLLTAIAKARSWIDDIVVGKISLDDIAKREGKVERHIRLLVPLAFASPRLISQIIDGTLPPATVTALAKRMAYGWAEQLATSEPHGPRNGASPQR